MAMEKGVERVTDASEEKELRSRHNSVPHAKRLHNNGAGHFSIGTAVGTIDVDFASVVPQAHIEHGRCLSARSLCGFLHFSATRL